MFDRLAGLETEYALRFQPHTPDGRRPANVFLVRRLVRHVAKKVPLCGAVVENTGWFLANGGAVRFERNPLTAFLPGAGLVEGATPECRGPRQLLLHQRAQDVLLSRAAVACAVRGGSVTLLKNNRDSRGNRYGCHENYEAVIASGHALSLWRALLVMLPLVTLPVLVVVLAVVALLVLPFAVLLVPFARRFRPGGRPAGMAEAALAAVLYPAVLPLLFVVRPFLWLLAFRRQRERMLAFLVSRQVIAGSGTVDARGRFALSPRALDVGSLTGSAAELARPVYYFGHVWKGVLGVVLGDFWAYAALFRERQRMQISVGDSNMAQTAEYLKVGTTLLVLEAIEAGALDDAPVLRRPIQALRAISNDPSLTTAVPVRRGSRMTALQIQRFYLDACKRFVGRCANPPAEAGEVLRLWEEALDALAADPRRMVGKLDWVTKLALLESAGPDAPVDALRKLDLRYHELSREGYYVRLEAAGTAPTIVEPEEVLAAVESPPDGTPAAVRGRLIREYASAPQGVRAGWNAVIIGSGKGSRVVHPGRHGTVDR